MEQIIRFSKNETFGDEFDALVRHLIQKHSALALAEEIRLTDYSIAKEIANELGIPHLIIEPTLEEKKVLDIDALGRIEMELMMASVETLEKLGWRANNKMFDVVRLMVSES